MIKRNLRHLLVRLIYGILRRPWLKKMAIQCARRMPLIERHLRLMMNIKNKRPLIHIEHILEESELSETSRHLYYQLQVSTKVNAGKGGMF